MSIRKREWRTAKGELRSAYVVDYADGKGTRRLKTFAKKKDAESFRDNTGVEVRAGIHVPDRESVTVEVAGKIWLAGAEADGLERSSIEAYESHFRLHMVPFLGNEKLVSLSVPIIRGFEDKLREHGRTPAMVRRVLVSLGTMLADAQDRGLANRNPVRDMRRRKKRSNQQEKRQKAKLRVGVDIPSREEIRAIVNALSGRWRPLFLTAIFCGLRASELRGLTWADVDLDAKELHVRQRADRFNAVGRPKSATSERTVPLTPLVVSALREWKLACPRRATGKLDAAGNEVRELHYVFPSGTGQIESLSNIRQRGFIPVQIAAGVSVPVLDDVGRPVLDKDGAPVLTGKYHLHSCRHFYASWLINRKEDGGLGHPVKTVQERLGHSSILLTMDTYSHLFPHADEADELAAAERALLG